MMTSPSTQHQLGAEGSRSQPRLAGNVADTSSSRTSHISNVLKPADYPVSDIVPSETEAATNSCTPQICGITQENLNHLSSEHVLLNNTSGFGGELSILREEVEPTKSAMDITMHPVIKSFIVGSISGTCSTVLFQPLDLLKTRLQSTVNGGNRMVALVGHIVKDEKLLGLWKGMTPSLTRCVPGVGLYFGSIHGLKIFLDIHGEPTAVQSIILGATARSISGIAMIPFTVIKTRFESKVYQYNSIPEAVTKIYQREGVKGLTCGLLPTLLRDVPFSALYLMMYSWTKQAVPKDWIENGTSAPYVRFSCGVFAGMGASLVTQPFDVVKTKMQLFPDRFSSVPPVLLYIHKKYGMGGFFKGLLPRMMRRTLIAAMSWTVYEQVMRNIGLQ